MPQQGSLFAVEFPPEPAEWVYLIGVQGRAVAKIGTAHDVGKRLAALQGSHYERLAVLWKTPGGRPLERDLHDFFARQRKAGEWFDFGDEFPVDAIRRAMHELGAPDGSVTAHIPVHIKLAGRGEGFTARPADDDPDAGNPLYHADERGCRWFTPLENIARGYAPEENGFWCGCGSPECHS